jgi:hypothetical protein
MFQKHDRVRHKDAAINEQLGILTIFEIKNNIAVCGYMAYDKVHLGLHNFNIADIVKVDE